MNQFEARKILGVKWNASFAEIKTAYRTLVKKHHPDVNPNGAAEFARIQQAYEVEEAENAKHRVIAGKAADTRAAIRKQAQAVLDQMKKEEPRKWRNLMEKRGSIGAMAFATKQVRADILRERDRARVAAFKQKIDDDYAKRRREQAQRDEYNAALKALRKLRKQGVRAGACEAAVDRLLRAKNPPRGMFG